MEAVKSIAGCGVMCLVWFVETNLTCIVIYSYNKTHKIH